MARKRRTEDELRAASEHLHYEVAMFDSTARILAAGIFGAGAASNAFLESFTVHVRALLQIFFPTAPQADDVLAEDFFDEPRLWTDIRGELPDVLGAVKLRVGKEIAHLTYARLDVTPEAKVWNIVAIWSEMQGIIRKWADNVPTPRLGPSWHPAGSGPEA